MARSFGRLFTSIWDDDDFRPLGVGAKLMYGFLISQDDLAHSGIIPWIPQRWAKLLGEPVEDILAWLKELEETRFTVTDDEVGELLVRSLIRRDDIWKQPNVFKAAAASAKNSKSPRIKATLYHEVKRLTLVGTNRETHALREELLSHLEPFANRSPNPPEGFPRGSGSLSEGSANGSERVGEGLANPSAGVTGKGNGYGPVVEVSPSPTPTPSPGAAAEPPDVPRLSVVPDVQAEEGDFFDDTPPDVGALVAELREIRPDWATRSIRRVLSDLSFRERPWPVARRAFLIVAADPATKHPGRVLGDGDWWHADGAGERAGPERLPWCGGCSDDVKRQVENADGTVSRCPNCHPLREAS